MSVRCALLFPRGDYYGGPTFREEEPIDLEVVPRPGDALVLNDEDSDTDEWYVDRVAHAPNMPDAKVWLFLRHDRWSES